jgi:hypothetical protein
MKTVYICRKRSLNKVVANTSSVAGYFNFLKVSWMPSTADKAERVGKIHGPNSYKKHQP